MEAQGREASVQPSSGVHMSRPLFISGLVMATLVGVFIGMVLASGAGNPGEAPPAKDATAWLPPETAEPSEPAPSEEGTDGPADEPAGAMETPDAPPGEPPVDSNAGPAANDRVHGGEVKSGKPVISSLTAIGLSAGEAQLVINALDGIFDFRRAQPGQRFEVEFDEAHRVRRFRYHASKTEIYTVERTGDALKGRKITVATQTKQRTFGGTITTSLFGTLQDLGARPALAAMVADILSRQVDFLKAQRPGDTFRVVVEEESLNGEILGYGAVLALEYKGAKAGRMRLFRFQEKGSDATYYDEKLVSIPRSALTIPLYYTSMTSPFGVRMHPVLKVRKMHTGVDFSASPGTPVWSCAEGQVTFAGNKGANGNLVSIRHESGLMSHYAHLQRIEPGIRSGVNVKRRQVIGYVGSTGRSTGPHLHWGITQNGKPIDPLKYRIIPGKKVAAAQRGALQSVVSRLGGVLDGIHIEPPKGELAVVPDNDEPMSDY